LKNTKRKGRESEKRKRYFLYGKRSYYHKTASKRGVWQIDWGYSI